MAQKNKPAASQPVSVEADLPVIHGNDVPIEEFPVNDFKGEMVFDLDPKQVTSIVCGNRIVLLRNGIESIMVTPKRKGSD